MYIYLAMQIIEKNCEVEVILIKILIGPEPSTWG